MPLLCAIDPVKLTMSFRLSFRSIGSSIGFPVWRANVSVVTRPEAYDDPGSAAARSDSAAARASQHVVATAIVPPNKVSLHGSLTEHHGHRILNVGGRDIAIRVNLPQGLDQSIFRGVSHCRLNMISRRDFGKCIGLKARL